MYQISHRAHSLSDRWIFYLDSHLESDFYSTKPISRGTINKASGNLILAYHSPSNKKHCQIRTPPPSLSKKLRGEKTWYLSTSTQYRMHCQWTHTIWMRHCSATKVVNLYRSLRKWIWMGCNYQIHTLTWQTDKQDKKPLGVDIRMR